MESHFSHPNTVQVIDFGATEAGTPFLVMEDVRGPSLAHLVERDWPLPLSRAVALMRQILAGLAEAHAAGVAHGDVKSDNVLVETLRDGSERVKIVDFGLARLLGRDRQATDPLQISGTPEYMAPELVLGHGASLAADVYAVGIILYELISASRRSRAAPRVLCAQLHEVVVPPSLRRTSARSRPRSRRSSWALAKSPDARPDAAAFSAAWSRRARRGAAAR